MSKSTWMQKGASLKQSKSDTLLGDSVSSRHVLQSTNGHAFKTLQSRPTSVSQCCCNRPSLLPLERAGSAAGEQARRFSTLP